MSDSSPIVYSAEEARDRETFLALLWAFSHPARWQTLPSAWQVFSAIGVALLDLETSFHTPDDALAQELARTGARHLPAHQAAYVFIPHFSSAEVALVAQAQRGSLLFPDSAATLILGIAIEAEPAPSHVLRGAGIAGQATLDLHAVPSALWDLRAQSRYPLGWDVILVDAPRQRVLGIPRSTQLTAI